MLKIWNSLHRNVEEFESLKPQQVGVYTCGPTVYNPATIGNLRSYIFADVLKRTLQFFGYSVKHVINITDVGHLTDNADAGEDKVEAAARRSGQNAWELAREYEKKFFDDLDRLNIERPDEAPRATENIPEQIALIETLEKNGFTYQTGDGIYFDTSKFKRYGELSGQKLQDKEAGARVAINTEKRHPTDFALWKFSPKDQKRQMEWESPWGVGFPGWHIECSAMSAKYLGQPFDIHTGGVDHIPVHHENEIAQSEAATGQPLAKYWMHNEFLLVDGHRMGKSEGNAFTLDDLIAKGFDPLAFRYYCLGTHYRSKMNFTWEGLEGAQQALNRLRVKARQIGVGVGLAPALRPKGEGTHKGMPLQMFREALADDFNTPKALAVMWDVLEKGGDGQALLDMDKVLGLKLAEHIGKKIKAPPEVRELAEQRQQARQVKDWSKADELRQQIQAMGWLVEDKEGGFDILPL